MEQHQYHYVVTVILAQFLLIVWAHMSVRIHKLTERIEQLEK